MISDMAKRRYFCSVLLWRLTKSCIFRMTSYTVHSLATPHMYLLYSVIETATRNVGANA